MLLVRLCGAGAEAVEATPLGTTLLLKWGWGGLSAADCQELAHHAMMTSCVGVHCDYFPGRNLTDIV